MSVISVLIVSYVKALVGASNQEKALVGAFSVIVKIDCETDESFYSTNHDVMLGQVTHWSAWIRRWSGQLIFALHL